MNYKDIIVLSIISLFQLNVVSYAATYTYDNLNRLSTVTYGAGKVVTYTYDNAGNIIKIQKSAGVLNSVDAVCGSTNGVIASVKPTLNLCLSGKATDVSGAGPWYWKCESNNGGVSPYCATATPVEISVTLTGPGAGSINSDPSGIACVSGSLSGCTASYQNASTVTLSATTSIGSSFTGWSGDCSGTAACVLSMTAAKSVTAIFGLAPKAKTGSVGYETLDAAYSNALPGADILLLDIELIESLNMNQGKSISLKGGYNSDFVTRSGNPTQLKGALTISNGSLAVDGLTIK